MDRKGQMTMFMILGVVIILFSSIGFYLYNQSTMSSFENKVDNIAQQMKITALDNYVESCLRGALIENLDSLALRGGFLGEIPPGNEFMSRGIVSIAIPDFAEYGSVRYPKTPRYPNTVDDRTEQEFHIEPLTPYPFGGRSLKKLCQVGGPNDAPLHIFARPCPRGSYGSDSIQRDLNLYVKASLESCVNVSYMNETTGYAIEVGTPIVSIVFGEEDVRAEAEFPITIEIDGDQAVRTIDFAAEVPVRLKKVYGLAQHIITNDRSYLTFDKRDMESAQWRSEYYDRRMLVTVECPQCSSSPPDYTDVVTITDTASDMDGRYLLFKFAVKNRIPVLEPMRGPSATWEDEEEVHFDVTDEATIDIQPIAIDPDEDELYVYYRGWMVDPSTEGCPFHLEGGERTADCDKTITVNAALFEREPGGTPDAPHNDHMLTVIVCDVEIDPDIPSERQESCDWQDVHIRRIGSVTLKTGVDCYYGDLGAVNCVSLEDPLILTTSGAPGTFTWENDEKGPFTDLPSRTTFPDEIFEGYISFITEKFPRLCLPRIDSDCGSALTLDNVRRNKILWIKDFMEEYVFGEIEWRRGSSTVSRPWTLNTGGMIESFDMDVSQCIPYGDPDINPPYPYNLPGDPFKAAHTCCKDTGVIKDEGSTCYSGTTYGPPVFDTLPDGAYDDMANDVYEKTVTHECDGVRGNMCGGEKIETIGSSPLGRGCNDFDIPGQVERCEGPSVTTRPGTDILTYECKQYNPGESFEKELELFKFGTTIGANGNCGGAKKYAAREGAGMYNPSAISGAFLCEGQCSAGLCDFAGDCVCNAAGRTGDSECDGLSYSTLQASGGRGVATAGGELCDINCQVVGPDLSATACRAAIDSFGGEWLPRSYSSTRSDSERCCGNSAGEFLPVDSGQKCCSVSTSCIIYSECVAPGETSPDGRYFCDAGTSRSTICLPTNECDVVGTKYCAGDRWVDLDRPVLGKICGGATAQCGTCREHPRLFKIKCLADDGRCSGGTCNADLQCV